MPTAAALATLTIPRGYPMVLLTASSSIFLLAYQMIQVSAARRKAKVPLPFQHVDVSVASKDPAAMRFNCAQRSHGNTLEYLTIYLMNMVFAGLAFPRASVAFGSAWLVSRLLFTIGYNTGDPAKRNWGNLPGTLSLGALHILSLASLIRLCGESGWTF